MSACPHWSEGGSGPAIGAWGRFGQYIYPSPALTPCAVRSGGKTVGVSWPAVFRTFAHEIRAATGSATDR